MHFPSRFALATAALCCGCTTVQIPLPGTHVMRPRAGMGEVGARVTAGAAVDPDVEGILSDIKDSNGDSINPLPGTVDPKIPDASATPTSTPVPVVELAVDWKNRFEAGFSSERGLFFMYDWAVWNNASLSITPSYGSVSVKGGDPKFTETTDANGTDVITVDHSYDGKATNFNLTQIASCWIGDVKWAALYLYGGLGVNVFSAEIDGAGQSQKASQVAPSALVGLHARLLIFELTAESGGTHLKYRDGTSKFVSTSAVSGGLHIDL